VFALGEDGVETQIAEYLGGIAIVHAVDDRYHAAGQELFLSFVYAVFGQV
jgi:hypothetical protein